MHEIDIQALQRQERLKKVSISSEALDASRLSTVRKVLITVFKPLLKNQEGVYITNELSEEMSPDEKCYYVQIKRKGITVIRKNKQKKDILFYAFKTGKFTINNQIRDAQDAEHFLTLLKNISRDVANKKAAVFEEISPSQ